MTYRELLEGVVAGRAQDRLVAYAELLERWSARHNLVRFGSREELVQRHLLDALAGEPWLPREGSLVDVGSGAGLPGIPLLCVRPELVGTLVEPRQKRWSFLRLAVRELGLEAGVHRCRAEDLPLAAGPWDRVTARAVGRHRELLGWARERLGADGRVLLWATAETAAELRGLPGWSVVDYRTPVSDRGRLVVVSPCST